MTQSVNREFDNDKQTTLSLMTCYAGLKRVELMKGGVDDSIDPGEESFIYFQIVEGCGYDVTYMTPAEALSIAANLTKMANELMSLSVPKV